MSYWPWRSGRGAGALSGDCFLIGAVEQTGGRLRSKFGLSGAERVSEDNSLDARWTQTRVPPCCRRRGARLPPGQPVSRRSRYRPSGMRRSCTSKRSARHGNRSIVTARGNTTRVSSWPASAPGSRLPRRRNIDPHSPRRGSPTQQERAATPPPTAVAARALRGLDLQQPAHCDSSSSSNGIAMRTGLTRYTKNTKRSRPLRRDRCPTLSQARSGNDVHRDQGEPGRPLVR